jgi:hypothetical protein
MERGNGRAVEGRGAFVTDLAWMLDMDTGEKGSIVPPNWFARLGF